MINKLKRLLNRLFRKDIPQYFPEQFVDPTYPADLVDMFPENRTEDHTDYCHWKRYGIDKPLA